MGLVLEDFRACSFISTAAAPSLMPEALPAATVPPLNVRVCCRQVSSVVAARNMLVGVEQHHALPGWQFHGNDLFRKRPVLDGGSSALLADVRPARSCITRG